MKGETIKPDIQDLPAFSSLSVDARHYLQTRLKSYRFSAGDIIIERGKRGQFWGLVGYGLVDLDHETRPLQTLLPGQSFGEAMLCEGAQSSATVMARSDAGIWVITRKDWLEAGRMGPAPQPEKKNRKTGNMGIWLGAGLVLLLFALFFVGPDLLHYTNETLVGSMLNAGRSDLAEKYLEFSLSWQPRSAVLYDAYGYSLYIQGKEIPAIRAFEHAVERDEMLASARNNLGVALLASWQTARAIEHLEAAAELDPGNPDAFFNLGNAYLAAGETEAAIKSYHRVIELAPDRKDAEEQWANLMLRKGELSAAQKTWEAILKADPTNARAHRSLGMIAVLEDRPQDALPELKQAYEAGIQDAEFYVYLGLAFMALDQPLKASAAFESAMTLTNDPALIQLAEYHLQDIESVTSP